MHLQGNAVESAKARLVVAEVVEGTDGEIDIIWTTDGASVNNADIGADTIPVDVHVAATKGIVTGGLVADSNNEVVVLEFIVSIVVRNITQGHEASMAG